MQTCLLQLFWVRVMWGISVTWVGSSFVRMLRQVGATNEAGRSFPKPRKTARACSSSTDKSGISGVKMIDCIAEACFLITGVSVSAISVLLLTAPEIESVWISDSFSFRISSALNPSTLFFIGHRCQLPP